MTPAQASPAGGGREERHYRARYAAPDLAYFTVVREQTDLRIGIGFGPEQPRPGKARVQAAQAAALAETVRCRQELETHVQAFPAFLTSLHPLAVPAGCPLPLRRMYEAAAKAEVGPMAAVAGHVAELVGKRLAADFPDVMVENGGDLWLKFTGPRQVGLWCGDTPFSDKLALRIPGTETPVGLCSSSGRFGHSLSLGRADVATILADTAVLADAVATALGNRVRQSEDVTPALAWATAIPGVRGALVVLGAQLGIMGDITLA